MRGIRLASCAFIALALPLVPAVAAASDSSHTEYTGRAVFELMADAEIPPPFHGAWAPEWQTCRNREAPGILSIDGDGIEESDGAMSVSRIWLYPGDAPNYDHAIIDLHASGAGGEWEESLILHLDPGGRALSVRPKGEDEASTTAYRKC